jgi:hypothetical protein
VYDWARYGFEISFLLNWRTTKSGMTFWISLRELHAALRLGNVDNVLLHIMRR